MNHLSMYMHYLDITRVLFMTFCFTGECCAHGLDGQVKYSDPVKHWPINTCNLVATFIMLAIGNLYL